MHSYVTADLTRLHFTAPWPRDATCLLCTQDATCACGLLGRVGCAYHCRDPPPQASVSSAPSRAQLPAELNKQSSGSHCDTPASTSHRVHITSGPRYVVSTLSKVQAADPFPGLCVRLVLRRPVQRLDLGLVRDCRAPLTRAADGEWSLHRSTGGPGTRGWEVTRPQSHTGVPLRTPAMWGCGGGRYSEDQCPWGGAPSCTSNQGGVRSQGPLRRGHRAQPRGTAQG